jgi:uncharacterized membrane protein
MMNIKRIARHLLLTHWQVNRAFPGHTLVAIEKALEASKSAHVGEIRFAAEGALHSAPLFNGQSASQRALDVFSQLRVWDTPHNNGVLIYLLLADGAVEIVADRGIHSKVDPREWETICRTMEAAFKGANFEGGVINGIQAVTQNLTKHFPASTADVNEVRDTPLLPKRKQASHSGTSTLTA